MTFLNLRSTSILLTAMLVTCASAAETLTSTLERARKVDSLLAEGYKKWKVEPNGIVDDATFVRRAYVNIVGRIPTLHETKSFLSNKQPQKRTVLIDKLVDSEGFKGSLFLFYSELLRLQSNKEQYGAALHQYIYNAAHSNKPYDKFVNEMLAAQGHVAETPAVGYYLRDSGMLLDNVSNTVQVFLGTQIGCAQCHDHPFEDTTQMDFYQLAAFSGGFNYKSSPTAQKKLKSLVEKAAKEKGMTLEELYKKTKKKKKGGAFRKYTRQGASVFKYYRRNELQDSAKGLLKLPHDYQYNDGKPGEMIKPKALFDAKLEVPHNGKRREVFANWVTSPENPMFTKVIANRLWAKVYGYGLAEPLDNWTERTKVSHEVALNFIAAEMKRNNYDMKQTLRTLYHTKLFQRSVSPLDIEGGKTYHFAGPLLRRMSGEELHDSFLALEEGKLDKRTNTARLRQWDTYVENFKTVGQLPAEKIIELSKGITKADKAALESRREAKKLKLAAQKAKAEGDNETYKKLMKEVRTKYKKAQKQVNMTMQSMQGMQMTETASTSELMKFAMSRNLRMRPGKRLRAAEMPQPFRAGSFVREFGSTDGEVSNNSSDHASIPQALSLLNGNEIIAVTDKRGSLPQMLKKAKSPKERLEILYLAIYSRYPKASEVERFSSHAKSIHTLVPLAKAMINSKSFLFIQ